MPHARVAHDDITAGYGSPATWWVRIDNAKVQYLLLHLAHVHSAGVVVARLGRAKGLAAAACMRVCEPQSIITSAAGRGKT
jgi:hypothetical protein